MRTNLYYIDKPIFGEDAYNRRLKEDLFAYLLTYLLPIKNDRIVDHTSIVDDYTRHDLSRTPGPRRASLEATYHFAIVND